jgi:glycine/D-amino acid oxidase-like deaminating enzyme
LEKQKTQLPYIGEHIKKARTFYALGFGGNGVTFSVVAAEIITDLLLGRKNKDADIFHLQDDHIPFTFRRAGFFSKSLL